MGTVIPADTSGIDNSEAEALTNQANSLSSSGSNDDDDEALDTTALVMLGDTGSTIVYTDGSTVIKVKKYNRGDGDLQTIENASESNSNTIIGGANRSNLPPGASISLSASAQEVQNALLYASYALGIVITVLLMFFHLLALSKLEWLGGPSGGHNHNGGSGRTSMGWLTPNTWELVVVASYIQNVNSISMLDLTKAPQIVLDFTDSFSFMNLHISSVSTTASSEALRRLQLIILTGIVAYSDRIGIDEVEALRMAFWYFLVVVVIIIFAFMLATGRALYRHHKSLSASAQLRYRVDVGLAVALFSLWVVVGGGLYFAFMRVRAIPINDAFVFKHYAVWGSLYGESKMPFRYFFVVTIVFQILLGVFTGAVSGVPAQLVTLTVTHLLFIVVVLIIRPFATRWALTVVLGMRFVTIVNLMTSFAFLTSSKLSTHWRAIVSQGFVVLNSIVFFMMFTRYVAIFVVTLKRWSEYTHRESLIFSQQSYQIEQQSTMSRADQDLYLLTYDVREHNRYMYNCDDRILPSGTGFVR
ncbi:hypothetical protein BBJ29_002704 [Phytophthora kernoviae]|uniref:TRP C-terminal domain-containing protein n=1 Tax=Phytophthora kernoviae TaxID=325452 RepID=A0A3F2RKU9_9STRA|nr:hypothetical protein BBJ29_002704 [Phytophthora kernoviae]RLN59418.1 hypothetical protein BBP00_00006509 [Phytophthora kernoviae]